MRVFKLRGLMHGGVNNAVVASREGGSCMGRQSLQVCNRVSGLHGRYAGGMVCPYGDCMVVGKGYNYAIVVHRLIVDG